MAGEVTGTSFGDRQNRLLASHSSDWTFDKRERPVCERPCGSVTRVEKIKELGSGLDIFSNEKDYESARPCEVTHNYLNLTTSVERKYYDPVVYT
ncbi:hypothetical protein TNCV_4691281 [Trichonephila clavipes]|nr:hypothetical protein TNCV_4691281 [Trichonephila clavipes]